MKEIEQFQYIEKQKNEWGSVAPAWKRWDDWLDKSMSPCNNRIIELAKIASGKKILDLGSGTGYPAIPAAAMVGKQGSVVGLDLSEEMLEVARLKAKSVGISNISFNQCDVTTIPFEDNRFDAMISRFCLMFLPNQTKTLTESFRVLAPGSYFAAAVWGEKEKNPAFLLPLTILQKYVEIPAPAPNMPGLFSLAEPGILKGEAERAGFSEVMEEKFPITWTYSSGQEYLEGFKDLAAPFKPLINRLSPNDLKGFEEAMITSANKYKKEGLIKIEGEAVIVSGKK